MIAYDYLDTPIGRLWVAVSPNGLCRIGLKSSEEDFVSALQKVYGQKPVRSASATAKARQQLQEYFAGQRRHFDLVVDLDQVTPFQRDVLIACLRIPFGETRTYAELARAAGKPNAFRAVGMAMAKNPIPLVIPCHRVIHSDQGLGGYGGGIDMKQWLLQHEALHRDSTCPTGQ
ncbi:MAG: methylated-DNA--[protein]-cysteine S-methyltransferase [Anaerolineae bacterium]